MIARTLTLAAIGAAALVFAGLLQDAAPFVLARLGLCGAALAAAAAIDLREHRIPNRLVLPAAAASFALALAHGIRVGDLAVALAVVAGMLVLALVRPAALGMGDVKLALLVAAGLDGRAAAALVLGLLLAAFAGVVLLLRYGRAAGARALPLAPFVAAGAVLALLP